MPAKPQSQPLKVTNFTNNSFTIKWDRWAGCTVNPDPIIYKIYIQQSGSTAGLSLVKQGKKLYAHTFSGLKKDTEYYVQVCAVDESGNVLQYPAKNAAYRIKTAAVDDNQVFVRIRSRRAASAGLNTWKTCSSGYVDVGTGTLKFKLTGSYYSYSVHLGGSAADGYAQFK